ncbi:helix-turn-helix transcriptional regulator [Actinomyces sp. MRS3W]|uniref:helix-turn-helix domain-containing protein n=1 Tax=Actinomyces sp. MRS3W TaxID=2800796 RepID=UPI0028FD6F1E|nr:helix-turn-helix transcriptional regulator [Actinomyces sp. MRS3W]MDU0348782.1 helix-turn-helix transcriptional regulator [Actinomyces sp. MRS3W]
MSTTGPVSGSRVVCHLDRLLDARGMTLVELSEQVGITTVNLSVLKNNRAKAIRFSTLESICGALDCTVGELLEVTDASAEAVDASMTAHA